MKCARADIAIGKVQMRMVPLQVCPGKGKKKSGVLNSTDEGVTGLDPGAYELQIKLMQESKTACVATASIATSVLDEDAGRFTMLCKMLETDLAQMLG